MNTRTGFLLILSLMSAFAHAEWRLITSTPDKAEVVGTQVHRFQIGRFNCEVGVLSESYKDGQAVTKRTLSCVVAEKPDAVKVSRTAFCRRGGMASVNLEIESAGQTYAPTLMCVD